MTWQRGGPLAAVLLACGTVAAAAYSDWPDYDRTIEAAAIRILQAKFAEVAIRGPLAVDGAAIVSAGPRRGAVEALVDAGRPGPYVRNGRW